MRKFIAFTFLILFATAGFSQNKKQSEQYIWDLLKRNNPDSFHMMNALNDMAAKYKIGNSTISLSGDNDYMTYVSQYDKEGTLASISTVIHESCHGYQSQRVYGVIQEKGLDYNGDYTVYYLGLQEEYLVKHTETFPSRKMVRDIKGDLRTFRFDTYINDKSKYLGTQQDGIYGLMEEWSAYYNGFRTTLLNFDDYSVLGEEDGYRAFLSDAGSIRLSYFEFKFYILQYLSTAQKETPAIYLGVVGNSNFKKAFQAIDKAFLKALSDYEKVIGEIQNKVEAKGLHFDRGDEYLMIGNRGVGSFNNPITTLKKAISSPKYDEIKAALNP